MRVASSDWWASRNVVSVTNSRGCSSTQAANFSGPSSLERVAHPWRRRRQDARALARNRREAGTAMGERRTFAGFIRDERVAVDDHLGDVGEQLAGAVLARRQIEQLRFLVDEARGAAAGQEVGVRDEIEEKRDVRLDAADAELLEAALHAAGGVHEAQAVGRHFNQKRIVKGRDDGAGEGGAGVEADAHAAGGAVVAEPAVVGQEVVGRVLRGDAALQGVAVRRDGGLVAEADFGVAERPALRDRGSGI